MVKLLLAFAFNYLLLFSFNSFLFFLFFLCGKITLRKQQTIAISSKAPNNQHFFYPVILSKKTVNAYLFFNPCKSAVKFFWLRPSDCAAVVCRTRNATDNRAMYRQSEPSYAFNPFKLTSSFLFSLINSSIVR